MPNETESYGPFCSWLIGHISQIGYPNIRLDEILGQLPVHMLAILGQQLNNPKTIDQDICQLSANLAILRDKLAGKDVDLPKMPYGLWNLHKAVELEVSKRTGFVLWYIWPTLEDGPAAVQEAPPEVKRQLAIESKSNLKRLGIWRDDYEDHYQELVNIEEGTKWN